MFIDFEVLLAALISSCRKGGELSLRNMKWQQPLDIGLS